VIGHIGEYSGVIGSSSRGGDTIARVAAAWINANGGLNGHSVKLVVGDSGSDPNRYLELVKKMVERDGAIAFFGSVVPLTAPAADPYLREKGIPIISGEGANPLWCRSPVMFFPGACIPTWSMVMGKVAVEVGEPKIGVLACREAEVCRVLNSGFQSREFSGTGAHVVYAADISLAQPSFTSECLQAQSRGVQTMVILAEANSVRRVARDCIQQGFRPQWEAVDGAVTASLTTDPNVDGLMAPQPQFPWAADDTPGAQRYHDALRRYAPNALESNVGALAWLGGMMLYRAAANLPATLPSGADLLRGLWSFKNETFDGLSVPVTFAEGQPSPGSNCMFVIQIKGGTFIAPLGSKTLCV
jgi:branched-chain amino acid transport system substrate-binding protein